MRPELQELYDELNALPPDTTVIAELTWQPNNGGSYETRSGMWYQAALRQCITREDANQLSREMKALYRVSFYNKPTMRVQFPLSLTNLLKWDGNVTVPARASVFGEDSNTHVMTTIGCIHTIVPFTLSLTRAAGHGRWVLRVVKESEPSATLNKPNLTDTNNGQLGVAE